MADWYWLQFRKCCPTLFSLRKPWGTWGEIQNRSAKGNVLLRVTSSSLGDLLYPHTHTHSREALLHLSWQTLWSVLRTHCSCCHCWGTAVTERLSVTAGDWRLATGKYVTASLGVTSHPYTCFSLACMIQLKMFVVYKHRHAWQGPRLKWMKSNRPRFRLDRVHKPNLYLDPERQEGACRVAGCSTQTGQAGCSYREFYHNHIHKQIATSSSIWCQRGIVSPTAQIWISLENRDSLSHIHTHTASLHETSNIDKVPF